MSTLLKFFIGILILVGVGAAAWWGGYLDQFIKKPVAQQTTETATSTPQQEEQPIAGMSKKTDASDAALTQDVGAIDTQLQGLTTDAATIDTSLSDKPVTQSY